MVYRACRRTPWTCFLLSKNFTANHFKSRGTADKGFAGEFLVAARAGTWRLCEIFGNPFLETFDQRAFATFAVGQQLCFALAAIDIDGGRGAFFVGFHGKLCFIFLWS